MRSSLFTPELQVQKKNVYSIDTKGLHDKNITAVINSLLQKARAFITVSPFDPSLTFAGKAKGSVRKGLQSGRLLGIPWILDKGGGDWRRQTL